MLAVEEWAQNKPPIIALLAPQFAAFARELPEIYGNLKKHKMGNHKATLPNLPTWYALYKNHRKYGDPFLEMVLKCSELADKMHTFGLAATEVLRNKEDITGYKFSADEIKEAQAYWKAIIDLGFQDLSSGFDDQALDENTGSIVEKYLANYQMELSFVLLVFAPCFMLYKISPGKLYHKARLGDVNAIDKLLRLDPLMLHDPAIGQQIQKIRLFGRLSSYQNLIEAPLKPIKAKITKGSFKASMGALISMMAEAIKQPLTSTEIKRLFDAVAKDADKRDIDTSLPYSPEAFYKSIQRKRPSWQSLLFPDSKKLK